MASHGSSFQKVFLGAAGSSASAGVDVDAVFSIDLWDGTGRASGSRAEQTITNGIDFSTNGGMVYIKGRGTGTGNGNRGLITSTPELGVGNFLYTSQTSAKNSNQTSNTYAHTGPNQYNTDGFKLGDERDGWSAANDISTPDYVGYSFRKAPKFFDVVAYTGNGTAREIAHNLGTTVGFMTIKKTSQTGDWMSFHRSASGKWLTLNGTDAATTNVAAEVFGNDSSYIAPSSTVFSVGSETSVNASNQTYVAYLFAHNNNDGGFGPDSDADIIKCDSYTGNGNATGTVVNLGFEPQWLLVRRTDSGDAWHIVDNMRGFTADGVIASNLRPNNSDAEGSATRVKPTSTGFQLVTTDNEFNANNGTYIYVAIRRGPLAAPDDADKVFDIDAGTTINNLITTGFNVDMAIAKGRNGTSGYLGSRLTGDTKFLQPNAADADADYDGFSFDISNGFKQNQINANNITFMWKRAPSFFDVVCYTGTGSARTISHNLGVVPEMMWVKCRSAATNWGVYYGDNTDYMILSSDGAGQDSANFWNDTSPTASVFTLGSENDINKVNRNYIAYLFATAPGVSKVGSYTGNATDNHVIDCGFSSGARFVLIKKFSAAGEWFIVDTVRGIVSGADPFLELNLTRAEITNDDIVDPNSSGFALSSRADCNANNQTYIFYAIA